MKIAIIISTNGGVISELLKESYFKSQIKYLVSDRNCGAINLAEQYGINYDVFPSKSGKEFSDKLLEKINWDEFDLIISFYTKLFKGNFLLRNINKLINIHPSILPACPGMNGYEDTLKSGSKFIGSTIHFVDQGMDSGLPIIQAARPYNPNIDEKQNRHLLFIDQCIILLQTIKWFDDQRVKIENNRTTIIDANYNSSAYSPNIDFDKAINMKLKLKL